MPLSPEKWCMHTLFDSESSTTALTWPYAPAKKPGEVKGNVVQAETAVYIYNTIYPQV